jgi:hypothetical protein
VGFGLLGLCFAARLGRMTSPSAAALLQETLTAFDNHWWPRCETDRLCPHWLQESSAGTSLEPWGNYEFSTIDTALFAASAHYATECLQPHAGPAAAALVTKYLTNLSWGYALPTSCDSTTMKLLVGVPFADTRPWSEYHILAYVAAAATATSEHNGSFAQDVGHCPAPRFYHRYLRADAYGTSIPGALINNLFNEARCA